MVSDIGPPTNEKEIDSFYLCRVIRRVRSGSDRHKARNIAMVAENAVGQLSFLGVE